MRNVIYKTCTLPAAAEKLFEMYLDPEQHGAFTGMAARIDGSEFRAFDGLLTGKLLHVVSPRLIVQSWRSVSFRDEDPESTLIISFIQEGDDGRIDLIHLDVPDHDFDGVTRGWDQKYFEPWRDYLERQ